MIEQATYSNINMLSSVHLALLYFSRCKTRCAQPILINIERSLVFMDALRTIGIKYAEKEADGTPRKYLLNVRKDGTLEHLPIVGKNPRNLPEAFNIIESPEYHEELKAVESSINFEKFIALSTEDLCIDAIEASYLMPLRQAGIIHEHEASTVHTNGISQSVH